jgi:peptide subunit release factor 1 (eRF1)
VLALCERLDGHDGEAVYGDGRVRLKGPEEAVLVTPPFGLAHEVAYDRVETGPLREHLTRPRVVGLLAVRLGGFAAGVYEDERLVAGRGGSRFVKGRNRKGGSSSGRFARRRGEQARDLHERAATLAEEVLGPRAAGLDELVLAGDRFALAAVLEQARLPAGLVDRARPAAFTVPDPRSSLLEHLGRELWSSDLVRLPSGGR